MNRIIQLQKYTKSQPTIDLDIRMKIKAQVYMKISFKAILFLYF